MALFNLENEKLNYIKEEPFKLENKLIRIFIYE